MSVKAFPPLAPGSYVILATPFDAHERLDPEGIARQVEFHAKVGARGVVVLAVMGEGIKVTEDERRLAVEAAVAAARGKVPVIVGVNAPSFWLVRRHTEQAARLGAQGVLLAPVAGTPPAALTALYQGVAGEGLPIVLQDYPPATGVNLSVGQIARVVEAVPAVVAVKNEVPPTGPRTRELKAALPRPVTILGGLGGLSLLDELDAGADGTMTGFAFSEVLVAVCEEHRRGNRERARELYEAFLPWLVFESTPGVGLGIRKEFLRWRGLLRHATLRAPAPALDEPTRKRTEELFREYHERASRAGLIAAASRPTP
ncbi:MAG: dihydrodipicolinate synthase family protein [Actinomycetia bacterium]|nr:dihydrodipicolinate synthase family protein [Actinomycetes bacterium]